MLQHDDMPRPMRPRPASAACSPRTCVATVAFAAVLIAWLRFTAASDVAVSTRRQFVTVAEYDMRRAPVERARPAAVEQPQPAYRQHEVHVALRPPAPLTALLPAELFPPEQRAAGFALVGSATWLANCAASLTFLLQASLLGAEYRQHFREANASLASLDQEIAPARALLAQEALLAKVLRGEADGLSAELAEAEAQPEGEDEAQAENLAAAAS